MQHLTGTVGESGANARHDTALVQAMLVLTTRPPALDPSRSRYLEKIDGDCGNRTKAAIRRFQSDRVFVDPAGRACQAVAGATAGRVRDGDATYNKLIAAVPAAFNDLRVLRGSKTVYAAADAAALNASITHANQMTFQAAFRLNVIAVMRRMFERSGIVIDVCHNGDRRTFQTQYELLTSGRNVTRAGPGESNHNFGQAVDLGFPRLRWLRENGTPVENEDAWLHQLDPRQTATGEALIFWNALRTTGAEAGLFRGPENDRPHLQAWSDAGIDMATRLAAHLTRVGTMRWQGRAQRYQCDLGFGGRFFDVGSAAQIWSRQSPVTVEMLAQARAQAPAPAAAGSGGGRTGTATPPAAPARPTAADIAAIRDALRADFDASDVNWSSWTPR
jgi:peptidoglycan hydrolase-like protein with peptidoglycan-binding domain